MSSKALVLAKPKSLPARLRKKLDGTMYNRLGELEPHTEKSYQRGLVHFAIWLDDEKMIQVPEAPEPRTEERSPWEEDAAMQGLGCLCAFKPHQANLLVEAYLRDLLYPGGRKKGYARSTVFSRLAALKWALKEMNRGGLIDWVLMVKMPKPEKDRRGRLKEAPGRDMRGPTRAQAKRLLKAAAKDEDPRAFLILSMCRHEGYREHEMRQINIGDIDFKLGKVLIVRKKRSEPKWYTLSTHTLKAIKAWLKIRGKDEGPLLTGGLYGSQTTEAIGASTIWRIVRRVGSTANVPNMSPHKIRHRACTDILDKALRLNWPDEETLYYTGHSSRAALQPYYESLKSVKSGRALLDSLGELKDDDD